LPTTRRSLSWGSRVGSFVCRPGRDALVRRDARVESSFEVSRLLPDRPSPGTLMPGSFFLDDGPLQSSFARLPFADLSVANATYQGSSPISDITGGVYLPREFPGSHYVPSSGFRSLSTVCSAIRLHGLIPSRSHVQGSTCPGASLPAQRDHPRRVALPPCR